MAWLRLPNGTTTRADNFYREMAEVKGKLDAMATVQNDLW
jgi:hypothetical protein